jgi:hypothetical protein
MFVFSRGRKERELRDSIIKKYFSSEKHKKVIKEAARKSAEDQRALIERYEKITAN